MNVTIAIILGLAVAVFGLTAGPFWLPMIALYLVSRRWLTSRAAKLAAEQVGSYSSGGIWFSCMLGWLWRSVLIYLLPCCVLVVLAANGNEVAASQEIGRVIGTWLLVGMCCLDAPAWPLRSVRATAAAGHSSEVYDQIAREFATNTCDKGLLLKSLTLAGGDRDKATAIYTAERAKMLSRPQVPETTSSTSWPYLLAGAALLIVVLGSAYYILGPAHPSAQAGPTRLVIASAPGSASASPATLVWNLPMRLGDDITKVQGIFGVPAIGQTMDAAAWEQHAKEVGDQSLAANALAEADEWRRATPNLHDEDYLPINMFLHYSSNKLVLISINNQGVNSQTKIYTEPVINGLLLTDTRDQVFSKLGAPNNPTLAGVPTDVAKGQESQPGIASVYCWDFGDTFAFVEIREKDEQTDTNVVVPKDSIANVTLIRHLPPDEYPPLEPH